MKFKQRIYIVIPSYPPFSFCSGYKLEVQVAYNHSNRHNDHSNSYWRNAIL